MEAAWGFIAPHLPAVRESLLWGLTFLLGGRRCPDCFCEVQCGGVSVEGVDSSGSQGGGTGLLTFFLGYGAGVLSAVFLVVYQGRRAQTQTPVLTPAALRDENLQWERVSCPPTPRQAPQATLPQIQEANPPSGLEATRGPCSPSRFRSQNGGGQGSRCGAVAGVGAVR